MEHWIDHERTLAGQEPRPKGRSLTGVEGEFTATHDDPAGMKPRHRHTWKIKAWFKEGQDARHLHGRLKLVVRAFPAHLPMELTWAEAIARHIGLRIGGCVAVYVWREDEPFSAFWSK